MCIFIDFTVILGVSWEPRWIPFCDFSVICCAKMGDCFQVHVFGDPGMDMMPKCNGCIKTYVFELFHVFHYFINFVSRGLVLGTFVTTFCDLGATFSGI